MGRVALGTWQRVVVVDPNHDNDVRTVRLSFVEAEVGDPRLEVLARRAVGLRVAAVVTAWTSRSRSSTRSSPSSSTSKPDEGRNNTRSPVSATRTSGPTIATSPHMQELRGGDRGRRDQQTARRLAFGAAGRSHDQPVRGESNLAVRSPPSWFVACAASQAFRWASRPWTVAFLAGGRRWGHRTECSERHRVRCLAMEARPTPVPRGQDAQGVRCDRPLAEGSRADRGRRPDDPRAGLRTRAR